MEFVEDAARGEVRVQPFVYSGVPGAEILELPKEPIARFTSDMRVSHLEMYNGRSPWDGVPHLLLTVRPVMRSHAGLNGFVEIIYESWHTARGKQEIRALIESC